MLITLEEEGGGVEYQISLLGEVNFTISRVRVNSVEWQGLGSEKANFVFPWKAHVESNPQHRQSIRIPYPKKREFHFLGSRCAELEDTKGYLAIVLFSAHVPWEAQTGIKIASGMRESSLLLVRTSQAWNMWMELNFWVLTSSFKVKKAEWNTPLGVCYFRGFNAFFLVYDFVRTRIRKWGKVKSILKGVVVAF